VRFRPPSQHTSVPSRRLEDPAGVVDQHRGDLGVTDSRRSQGRQDVSEIEQRMKAMIDGKAPALRPL
jgi:hypothetical protein